LRGTFQGAPKGDSGATRRLNLNDKRLAPLRAKYRRAWDAHQVIADHNARIVKAGKQPSNDQLINEQRAAEAVVLARDELFEAISGVGN